ncbi:unnamed protein product [Boreogadus saida]
MELMERRERQDLERERLESRRRGDGDSWRRGRSEERCEETERDVLGMSNYPPENAHNSHACPVYHVEDRGPSKALDTTG